MLPPVTTPRHRRPARLVLTSLVALLAASLLPAPVARAAAAPADTPAGQIAGKKAEAERIERELEEQGRRVSILAEDLNESRLEAERLAGEVSAVEAQVRETVRQMEAARTRLKLRAVTAYMRGGHLPAVGLVADGPADEMGLRQAYVGALVGQDRGAVDDLDAAREEGQARRAQLEAAQRASQEALAQVENRRRAAAAAAAAQRATLEQVQGELSDLVAAEARRRAEEEARRAKAILAAREAAAREAARRAQAAREAAARRSATAPVPTAPAPAPGGAPRPTGTAGGPTAGAETAVAEAKRQLGKPYEWGAAGPDSFDCSGLTSWAWKAAGKSLSHSSRAQYSETVRVPVEQVQLGDLVFYGEPIHHVGIYVGDGRMVEASETGTPVRYASIYRTDIVGVGRVQ